ncbi:gas vesicle protein [Oceanobacillus piezotolerans]|uniref:Gas vesicle protein n=1 Tax=Oceanobacillus piezotolerans TaxID=2448030 RepID=A0A498D3Z8_9BACI|nr:gas vesicle protein [Oceanobacillus piezotolerans]RLL42689.1 gas vesicle protein [Oceanobacillus piezotolerans]
MSERNEYANKEVGLIDVLDVVLDKGVAIKGDLILSIAGIDLVYLDLRVLIASVETLIESNKETAAQLSSKQFDREKEELDNVIHQS